ncbi:Imm1 family immunity protein [Actinacidiphila glaucinigra]
MTQVVTLKVLGSDPVYLGTPQELRAYLAEIFDEDKKAGYANRDFQVVVDGSEDTDNVLSVGVDYDSGCGAILWYCTDRVAEQVTAATRTDMAEYAWVSWSANPPQVDPQIVSDPGCPSFFDHVSAIPLREVRSAVEEYYREGSGFRPTVVQWVKGNFNGELLEE